MLAAHKKNDEIEGQEAITRFGTIRICEDKIFSFPLGLLGLQENLTFGLADMPKTQFTQFKILHSMEGDPLSFIVFPLPLENALLLVDDLRQACLQLNIVFDNALLLLITSIYKKEEKNEIIVNLKAPVIIDKVKKIGGQYVFSHQKYPLKFSLTE